MSEDRRKIRVLIVDDHPMVRQGLRLFLDLQDDIEIAGEAENGEEAVHMAGELQPDVILMDLVMPVMDGIRATEAIRRQNPRARIIALTSFIEDDKVLPVIRAGAIGYLLKDVQPTDLVAAIRAAFKGQSILHPDATKRLVNGLTETNPADELSPRERDVLHLIAKGRSNKEIAAELNIGEKTVKTHVSNVLAKLGVQDRTQAALYAVKHGLADD